MTHEDYVSFEQAKALKTLGFDWECYQFYNGDKKLWSYTSIGYGDDCRNWNDEYNAAIGGSECSAPTLAQAAKWLREVKQIIIIPCVMYKEGVMKYDFYIVDEPIDLLDSKGFDTYEEALSAGIDKTL